MSGYYYRPLLILINEFLVRLVNVQDPSTIKGLSYDFALCKYNNKQLQHYFIKIKTVQAAGSKPTNDTAFIYSFC
jgi:hypothetical protein